MLLSNVLLGLTAVYASLGEVQAVRRCPRRCPDTWEARELSPYPHICHDPQVTLAPVRGTSRSTKTSTSVSTTSVKLSATRPTATSSTSTWFKPTPGTSFLWSLGKAIPSNPIGKNNLSLKGMQVYDVDLFDSTPSQIAEYKKQGKKVVCYFSAGSFENGRSDASSFNKDCYCNNKDTCKLDGWEEWWLDLHTPACLTNVQTIMKKRIELAKVGTGYWCFSSFGAEVASNWQSKGCDAVEPDNTDSYTNGAGWQTTITDQFNYLQFLSTTAHSLNLGIALKNGPDMISKKPEIVSLTDFVIIEECQAYNECNAYQPFVNAGKAAFQVEYERSITCSKILPGFFALSYTSYDVDYTNVQAFCPKA